MLRELAPGDSDTLAPGGNGSEKMSPPNATEDVQAFLTRLEAAQAWLNGYRVHQKKLLEESEKLSDEWYEVFRETIEAHRRT